MLRKPHKWAVDLFLAGAEECDFKVVLTHHRISYVQSGGNELAHGELLRVVTRKRDGKFHVRFFADQLPVV